MLIALSACVMLPTFGIEVYLAVNVATLIQYFVLQFIAIYHGHREDMSRSVGRYACVIILICWTIVRLAICCNSELSMFVDTQLVVCGTLGFTFVFLSVMEDKAPLLCNSDIP